MMKVPSFKKLFLSALAVGSIAAANLDSVWAVEKSAATVKAPAAAAKQIPHIGAYLPAGADAYLYMTSDLLDMFLSENTIKMLNQLDPNNSNMLKKQDGQAAACFTVKKVKDDFSVLIHSMNYYKDPAQANQAFNQELIKFLPKELKQTVGKFEGKDALTLQMPIKDIAKNIKGRFVKESSNLVSSVVALNSELPANGFSNKGKKSSLIPSDDVIFKNTIFAKNLVAMIGDLEKEITDPTAKNLLKKLDYVQSIITLKNKKYSLDIAIVFQDEAAAKLLNTEFQKQNVLKTIKDDPSLQGILPDASAQVNGKAFQFKSTVNAEALKSTVDSFVMLFSATQQDMIKNVSGGEDKDITVEKETSTAPAVQKSSAK